MTTKLAIAALLTAFAAPAFAAGTNAGHEMQANLLNLDAAQFSANELAQIESESTLADKIARIRLIEESKGQVTTTF